MILIDAVLKKKNARKGILALRRGRMMGKTRNWTVRVGKAVGIGRQDHQDAGDGSGMWAWFRRLFGRCG